ncbi:MAG: hypothetical protein GTO40_28255, partial [Deltaproteobacteria bacterium]|nr:hypothetical protein [Deltaproteobacteria bacterium]
MNKIDPNSVDEFIPTEGARGVLEELEKTQLPLIHDAENSSFTFQGFFKDFLLDKLHTVEGREETEHLNADLA